MKRIFAVAVKEVQVFFYSPLLYVLWALFFFFNSWAFVQVLKVLNDPVGVVQIAPVEIFFGGTIFFWLLAITLTPLITMRAISEEKRTGTIEVILTAPVSEWELVLGKFLGINLILLVFWLSTIVYPLLVSNQISFHWPAVAVAMTGVVLLNAVFSSIGIFASSLTANQVVSAFLSFVMIIVLFTLGIFSQLTIGLSQRILSYLSVLDQFQNNFAVGIVDTRAVVYFLSLTVVFLALSWLVLVKGRRRRLDSWITLLLLVFLLVGLNVFSFRHWRQWDLSGQNFYYLSDRAKDLLREVSKEVEVFVCLSPDNEEVRNWIEKLLRDAQEVNPRIKFTVVDPARDVVSVRNLFEEFKVDPVGMILVKSGTRKKVISERDLIEMDYSPVMKGEPPRISGFNGEKALVSAILAVAKEGKEEVFFVSGHGERRLEDFAPGRGLSQLRDVLVSQGIVVQQDTFLKLKDRTEELPVVVVFSGPRKDLLEEEKRLVERLLKEGVGFLFLLDPGVDEGLAQWFSEVYGVKVGNDVVVDPSMSVVTPINLVINFFSLHPITAPFVGNAMLLLSGACSLDKVGENEKLASDENGVKKKGKERGEVYKLIFSSPGSWAEKDWKGGKFSFDEGRDVKGPICVGLAWERGKERMVVIGDSNFLTNEMLKQLANEDFFFAVMDWLRAREVKVELGTKEIKTVRMAMPAKTVFLLALFTIMGLPMLALTAGGIVVFLRRRLR